MQKLTVFAFFAVFAAAGWGLGRGYAQEMPPEVKAFLDNYTKDSTAAVWGPLAFKKNGVIPDSVPIKNLKLRVIQEYAFNGDINLEAYPDTVALSDVIVPSGRWHVAVMSHDKVFCVLILRSMNGKQRFVESSVGRVDYSKNPIWGPLLRVYPESTGINPVLVAVLPKRFLFLYFKQKGPRKIYYPYKGDGYYPALDSLFTASIETLDDSKNLIAYMKKREIDERAERMRLEKAKNNGKEENVEPKKIMSHPAIYSIPAIKQEELEINRKELFPVGGGK